MGFTTPSIAQLVPTSYDVHYREPNMNIALSPTVVAAFGAVMSADATRPALTFFDDATGERTELSGATLANWVAKTANLLTDGAGLGPGDVAAVRLPVHWQAAGILLGCWSAGLAVSLKGTQPAPIAFAAADRLDDVVADDTYALALTPLAMPFRPGPPDGTLDYAVEVRGYGDHFSGPRITADAAAYASGVSHGELVAAARALPMPAGSRVLIDGDAVTDPVAWLVAPLLAGTSVVLCRNLDPAKLAARLAAERAVPFPPVD
jgi:uncharacterized protein (TIGR03089 family)